MTKILAISTHGTDDPTLCTFPWATAVGALTAGKEISLVLLGEAVYLAKDDVPKAIFGVGLPPLSDLIDKVVAAKVPIHL
jgi:predicted peroxiredoxin